MAAARSLHTATLLKDGRVLVAGGYGFGYQGVAFAELYDPATGKFTATEPMPATQDSRSATLLPNGRVLFVGNGTAAAEVFDPGSGALRATGSMVFLRYSAWAFLLDTGQVLVVGGDTTGAAAEIYQP
jgi:hypothetical protein